MTLTSVQATIGAVHPYWRALTWPGRVLLVLQAAAVSHSLLATDPIHRSPFLVESLTLVQFLVVWCAWSEQLFSLRRCFQATGTLHPSLWRRLTLDLYGGFLFMAVLSLLVAVHPLLGIGAMFLLFTSVEALDVSLGNRLIATALAGGSVLSYRLISREPWRFLARLLLPGLVLYAGGTLVVGLHRWAAEEQAPPGLPILAWLLTALALTLWLAFFALAQMQLQVRSMAKNVDKSTPREGGDDPVQASAALDDPESLSRLRLLAGRFSAVSRSAATTIAVVIGLWLVFQLERNGLLTMAALVLAFQGMVAFVGSTVQAFLDLLLKLGFLAVVVGAVACGVLVLIGLGRGRPLGLLRGLAVSVRNAFSGVGDFLAVLQLSGATLGIGTLLTALGTIAVQTYAQVQKDQLQQRQVQQTQELRSKEEQAVTQQLNNRLDGLQKELNGRVAAFLLLPIGDKAKQDQRALMVSNLREVLPQLRRPDGQVDGVRMGTILRHLYEAGLLLPSDPNQCSNSLKESRETFDFAQLGSMSQLEAEQNIRSKFPGCLPGVYLDSMDFSGASLSGAFLKKSFLPFINLSYADLRGAQLKGAILRHARLENADLSGADLRGADLRGAVVAGSDLTAVQVDCGTQLDGLVAFYAQLPARNRKAIEGSFRKCPQKLWQAISWDPLKGQYPFEKKQAWWTFCPLAPENQPIPNPQIQSRIQAGAKCANRRFKGGDYSGSRLMSHPLIHHNQNWSGGQFSNTHFEGLTLKNVALLGAALDGAQFRNVRLENVDFSGANLEGAIISNSTLEGVNFSGANLRKLRFERVRARNVHLQGIVIDRSLNLGTYNEALQLQAAFSSDTFESRLQDELATFRQDLLAPILFGPLPLRPLNLLYWMLPNALPQPFAPPPGTAL